MIIITGASDGLGLALAKLYRADNKQVISLSRSESSEATRTIITDLTDEASIAKAAVEIGHIDEPLEALINAAGVMSIEEASAISAAEVDKVLDTNIRGPILLTSRLMGRLKRDGGDVINVASTVGTKAYTSQAAYGASKWALRGFSANLQVEFKGTSCRVISFCPGGFISNIFQKATGRQVELSESDWMSADDVARCLKQLLELPKSMEVSEIIINRKAAV